MTSSTFKLKGQGQGREVPKLATLSHVGLSLLVLQTFMVTGTQTHAVVRDAGDSKSTPSTKPAVAVTFKTKSKGFRTADWLNLEQTTSLVTRQTSSSTISVKFDDKKDLFHSQRSERFREEHIDRNINLNPKPLYFKSRTGTESFLHKLQSKTEGQKSSHSSCQDKGSWLSYIQTLLYNALSQVFQPNARVAESDFDSDCSLRGGHIEHTTIDSTLNQKDQAIVHDKSRSVTLFKRSRRKRSASSTSKFTGLVVGATQNNNLQSSVAKFLKDVEKSIWQRQSNVTMAFSKEKPASILGSFDAQVFTNFRGIPEEAKLRQDPAYQFPDVNALTQLLVLNCLTEAGIYGSAQNPDVGEVLDMLSAIDTFHLKDRNGGSILITMWPEQLLEGNGGQWQSYPENILLTTVKDRDVRGQLQGLVSGCDACKTSKDGLKDINSDTVCGLYFSTPFSVLVGSKGRPPDVLNSFANLALGAIFNAKIRQKDKTDKQVFATELARWTNSNTRIDFLIEKLKQMVIVFPTAKVPESTTTSPQPTSTSTTTTTTTTKTTTTASPTISTIAAISTSTTTSTTTTTSATTTTPAAIVKPTTEPTTSQWPPEPSSANLTISIEIAVNFSTTTTSNVSSAAASPLTEKPTKSVTTSSTRSLQSPNTTVVPSANATVGVQSTISPAGAEKKREIELAEAISRSLLEAKNSTWTFGKLESLVAALFQSLENETFIADLVSKAVRTKRSVADYYNDTVDAFVETGNDTTNAFNETSSRTEEMRNGSGDIVSPVVKTTSPPQVQQISAPTLAWPSTTPTPPSKISTQRVDNTVNVTHEQIKNGIGNVSTTQETNSSSPTNENTPTKPSSVSSPGSIASETKTKLHNNMSNENMAANQMTEQDITRTVSQNDSTSTSSQSSSTPSAAPKVASTTKKPTQDNATKPTATQPPPKVTATASIPTNIKPPPSIPPPPPTTTQKTTSETSVEPHVNQILDSVSYFALHDYLDDVLPSATEDVLLIPSMLSDSPRDFIKHDSANSDKTSGSSGQSEASGATRTATQAADDGDLWHNGQVFDRYNSVDLTSTATTVHALVVSSMVGLLDINTDIELQNILRSSLRFLTWMMTHPDKLITSVALSRFPSRFQLYLVLSRITFQLTSLQSLDSDLFNFARSEISDFLKAVHGQMTFAILDSIKDGGLGADGKTRVYIDNFVGTSDLDQNGKPMVSGDDRVFSSAVAASTLIFSWTTQEPDGSLKFDKDTPDAVRIAVNSLVNFVIGKVLSDDTPHTSILMADLVKNCDSLPFRFPYNTVSTKGGQPVKNPSPDINLRYGVKGYIAKDDYQNLLNSKQFGRTPPSPASAGKLNGQTSYFHVWSSLVYTRAVSLLAVSLAGNLQVNGSE